MSIATVFTATMVFTGCAWETGSNDHDAGEEDAQVTRDAADEGPQYPPGPYGTDYGDTLGDFTVLECLCPGGPAQGKEFRISEFLGAKAILVTVHTGTCHYCKIQASTMEADLAPYRQRGLEVLAILFGDDAGRNGRQEVLDYCCEYRQTYNMTFKVTADPDALVSQTLITEGTPLNILLDDEMVIRYKVEALVPETLEGNINALLDE
jgi:peroxiredoxin